MELKERAFVLMDTETNGLDEKTNQILEVALLVIRGGTVISELEVKIKHKEYTPSIEAMKVNKIDLITHEKEAVFEEEACNKILKFLNEQKIEDDKGFIVMGQNVSFDIKFMDEMFRRNYKLEEYRKFISHRNLDLMQLALIKNIEGKIKLEDLKLDTILKGLKIDIPENRHRALSDCYLEFMAYERLLNL